MRKTYRVVEIENGSEFVYCHCDKKEDLQDLVDECWEEHDRHEKYSPYEHDEDYSYEVQVQKFSKETNKWEEYKKY